jgi:hypothetical protein
VGRAEAWEFEFTDVYSELPALARRIVALAKWFDTVFPEDVQSRPIPNYQEAAVTDSFGQVLIWYEQPPKGHEDIILPCKLPRP